MAADEIAEVADVTGARTEEHGHQADADLVDEAKIERLWMMSALAIVTNLSAAISLAVATASRRCG